MLQMIPTLEDSWECLERESMSVVPSWCWYIQAILMCCDTMHFIHSSVLLLKCSLRARESSRNTCCLRLRHHLSVWRAAKHYNTTKRQFGMLKLLKILFLPVFYLCHVWSEAQGDICTALPDITSQSSSVHTWFVPYTVHWTLSSQEEYFCS